jgi:hypothetical protein
MKRFTVDRARWQKLSLFEQLGNVSSEIGRSLQARRSGSTERMEASIERALDLIEATVQATLKAKPYRAKEILRAKDQYLRLFFGGEEDLSGTASVERYFAQFAMAARMQR